MTGSGERKGAFTALRILVVVVGVLLAVRIIQIQVFSHDHYGQIARVVWGKTIPLNPMRGRLYDRNGKSLALSVTTWQVGISPARMENVTQTAQLVATVVGLDRDRLERRLRRAGVRHQVVGNDVVLTRDQKLALEKDPSVTLDGSLTRIYPHDGVGASLLGFFRYGVDDTVATGLEYSLSAHLAGKPGLARTIKTPVGSRDLGQVVLDEPVAGQNVTLTLDEELQAVCEDQLAKSVARCGAQGGSVLIMDPHNGDILAAASWPLLPTRAGPHADPAVWNNRNFTSQYEPGSVFKVFTMASLLKNSAIDTATVFDCSDPRFDGYTIDNENHHRYGNLSLMQAFTRSSNIYFARAVGNLSDQEFYRDLVGFGFGQLTSMPYRGQARGILRDPMQWSRRSKSTLAIGQEIALTPLQLGLALCSVANGGMLYAPRLIREISSPENGGAQEVEPLPLRRVMNPDLAALMRVAMGRVVAEGTGVKARLDWIRTGGKTGTAQLSKDGKTLAKGAFMASFGGIAPLDKPRLVILTVLDQPRGIYHFASESAVPLFRDILQEIRNETDWLTDVPGSRTALVPAPWRGKLVPVPDVLFLTVANAAQRLTAEGFAMAGAERPGMVVQQVPGPGSLCEPGSTVKLTVSSRQPDHFVDKALCPDFQGLSDRQVRSLAGRLGIAVQMHGNGYTLTQSIPAGQPLDGRTVSLKMGDL